jgi:hypothetical protein
MPRVGFELKIPVFERAKKVHALDHSATVIDIQFPIIPKSTGYMSMFLTFSAMSS